MRIERGKALKNSGEVEIQINFSSPFPQPPTVVVSPHWENQHDGVGHAETIDEITTSFFRVVSNNGAPNYFVEWIAIGDG